MKIGDIVIVWSTGTRKLVVGKRDEIVARAENLPESHINFKLRTVYRLAGKDYSNRWFNDTEISSISSRTAT
jgi:hypothetical protein